MASINFHVSALMPMADRPTTNAGAKYSLVKSVKVYQLWDHDPLPSYARNTTVLIGDAAHPTVLYQGQGANQALEDAEGLCLFNAHGVTKDQVPDLLQKWQLIRP
jgi:salicylate hydroxylase